MHTHSLVCPLVITPPLQPPSSSPITPFQHRPVPISGYPFFATFLPFKAVSSSLAEESSQIYHGPHLLTKTLHARSLLLGFLPFSVFAQVTHPLCKEKGVTFSLSALFPYFSCDPTTAPSFFFLFRDSLLFRAPPLLSTTRYRPRVSHPSHPDRLLRSAVPALRIPGPRASIWTVRVIGTNLNSLSHLAIEEMSPHLFALL